MQLKPVRGMPRGGSRLRAAVVCAAWLMWTATGCLTGMPPTGGVPGGSNQAGGGSGGGGTGGGSGTGGGTNNGGVSGGTTVASLNIGDLEQLTLERINRARLRPGPEASRFGITVDEGIPGELNADPKQPVTYNATLADAARRHAEDMLANNFFAHNNLSGQTPFDRMRNSGYSFSAAGENLAWRGTTGSVDEPATTDQMHQDLFVDEGIADRGHRKVMLNASFREVGLSVRRGRYTARDDRGMSVSYDSLMMVQDYGVASGRTTYFVLGVVYSDRNSNGQYDFGEGSGNQSVSLGDMTTTTANGGGYAFEVAAGTYTLSLPGGRTRETRVRDKNIKVDLVNGSRIDVNLGLGEF